MKGKVPGSFRQSRGGVIDFDSVLAWLPIEKTEIDIKELWCRQRKNHFLHGCTNWKYFRNR